MKIRIRLANENQELKPAMFANVVIENKSGQEVLAIPSSSFISDYGKDYVVVYHSKCNLEVRRINIIKTIGDTTYISDGLQRDEKIVSQNQVLLFKALTDANN